MEHLKHTAAKLGVELVSFDAGAANYPAALQDARVEGVVIASSPIFSRNTARLPALAVERWLATLCERRQMARDGCLIGYGPGVDELRVRTADFVVRLCAGGKASDMPFEQPSASRWASTSKPRRRLA